MSRACVVLVGLLAGCRSVQPVDDHASIDTDSPKPAVTPPESEFDPTVWNQRCVIVQGYAQAQKIGPLINLGGPGLGVIFADPQQDWQVPLGARVELRGRVVERADLPVFVQDPDQPAMQGMPVAPGTDLEQARKRWVIEQAEVTSMRTTQQVESALEADLGRSVALPGILWSRNNRWWFNHEGVDIQLEGGSFEHQQHGQAVIMRGVLSRQPPAYVLRVESIAPHPRWDITAC